MLKQLVNELTTQSGNSNKNAGNGRGGGPSTGRNRRRKARKRAQPTNNGGQRGYPGRNPSNRGDVALSLTRSQFTATSPLNLFQIHPASTPGGMRAKGQELLSSLALSATSTGAFQILNIVGSFGTSTSIVVNPRQFARLAQLAPTYEMYVFHKFHMKFMSNQPTTKAGEIILSVDYDMKDNDPTSVAGMMRNISSVMANIYSDASLQVLKSLSRLPKYLVAEDLAPDLNQVHQARAYAAIEGFAGTVGDTVGYLVVEYDIEFFTPC